MHEAIHITRKFDVPGRTRSEESVNSGAGFLELSDMEMLTLGCKSDTVLKQRRGFVNSLPAS
jgi:hypothetical protein